MPGRDLSSREFRFMLAVLTAIVGLVCTDLITDAGEGAGVWHLILEATAGITAGAGIGLLLREKYKNGRLIREEKKRFDQLQEESEKWRKTAKSHMDGLSAAIEKQLDVWEFSAAEKEVAFLLLKGFSIREVAEIRHTAEKTVKVQAAAIYSKSGLSGRAELSAFFLEDLFTPTR